MIKANTGTTRYVFYGTFKWFKYDKPDDKYNNFGVDLYLDDNSLRLFKKTGLQLSLRDDEDGFYVKFKRPERKVVKKEMVVLGPPEVTFSNGEPPGTLVGNGSKGSVTVAVFDTTKGKGHTWESAVVEELVPYGGNVIDAKDFVDEEPEGSQDLNDEIPDLKPKELVKSEKVPGKRLQASQIPF